jgi:L-2-hydroxyglutarate oxidase LhgO
VYRDGAYYVDMDQADVVIVGAGVIGLAVARALAMDGRDTWILEAAAGIGTQISSRSSEVIHAGIYYPRGSLKATLCVAGREQLYEFCEARGVPFRRCGKLIVATSESQLEELEKVRAAAHANGVQLECLSEAQAKALEPALACFGALHSPASGIVDSHAYMLALLGEAESHGATLICGSRVTRVRLEHRGVFVAVEGSNTELRARMLINCAGLHAPQVARMLEGFPAEHVPRAYFAKGSYFALAGRAPFNRLVYPLPEPGGLGVHLTLDLAGRARFGPDMEWIEECDYAVDPQRAARFYGAVRRYWPALPDGALEPAYAGIRPKISGPTEPAADFRIDGPATHGVPAIVNLFGIESPGLTASLAIAQHAASIVRTALSCP